ncbi:unnamed protein product [marine sediment metagenome]|uniref:arginine decarboxylase n=1 Tax=marine sediment metagenome TaxID=412755 RepID=X1UAG9_9ZZZZ
MFIETPTKYFLASGKAEGITPLNAFDNALLDAGVANTNLLKLTSILPPRCEKIDPFKLPLGAIIPVVYSLKISSTAGEFIVACVGIGIPEDSDKPGLIMEYSCSGGKKDAERIIGGMVEEGFKQRKEKLKTIEIASAEIKVEREAAVCAAVVFWR